jgi:hypothetical protein
MIELVANTIRMRIADPKKFSEFRSKDIGSHGKLSIIVGKKGDKWFTQSYRFNLPDYASVTDVLHDARTIKNISESDLDKIASLTRKYFHKVNG